MYICIVTGSPSTCDGCGSIDTCAGIDDAARIRRGGHIMASCTAAQILSVKRESRRSTYTLVATGGRKYVCMTEAELDAKWEGWRAYVHD